MGGKEQKSFKNETRKKKKKKRKKEMILLRTCECI